MLPLLILCGGLATQLYPTTNNIKVYILIDNILNNMTPTAHFTIQNGIIESERLKENRKIIMTQKYTSYKKETEKPLSKNLKIISIISSTLIWIILLSIIYFMIRVVI